jgi:DNA primase
LGYVFPGEILEEIKSANGVYEVISEYVPLQKKSGRNYVGLCPFHAEKTPSFHVNPERRIFHCFGCNAGGDVFSFLMQYENIPFAEAVRVLAARAGLVLPSPERRDEPEEKLRKDILEANGKAGRFFQEQLESAAGREAREYLAGRGMTGENVTRFRIGWSPKGWDGLRNHLRKAGFDDEVLVKAGLAVHRKEGTGCYDRFRNRLMFPIAAPGGETVAFGGRAIDPGDEPKYINSPETPLFQKGRMLYGLDLARGKIREAGRALVVEGYTDLIAAHAAGVGNTVATLGTALTREHLRLLKRYAPEVVLLYDGDAAGIAAAKRSLELFMAEDVTVSSTPLPGGHDPDSFIRAHGAEAFREALAQAVPLMEFFIRETAATWRGKGVEGKSRGVEEMMPVLAAVASAIKRSEYVRLAAALLDIREEALSAEVARRTGERTTPEIPRKVSGKAGTRIRPEEMELVRAILLDPALRMRLKEELSPADFDHPACRAVAVAAWDGAGRGEAGAPTLADPDAAALVARILAEESRMIEEGHPRDLSRVVDDCLSTRRGRRRESEKGDIQEKIRRAGESGDPDLVDELLRIKQTIART